MQRKISSVLACVLPLVVGACGSYALAVEGKEQRRGGGAAARPGSVAGVKARGG